MGIENFANIVDGVVHMVAFAAIIGVGIVGYWWSQW